MEISRKLWSISSVIKASEDQEWSRSCSQGDCSVIVCPARGHRSKEIWNEISYWEELRWSSNRLTTSGSFVSFLLWWVYTQDGWEFSSKYPCWAWIFWPCPWLLASEHNTWMTTLLCIVGFNNIERNFRNISFPRIHRNPSCVFWLPIHVELARAHLSIQYNSTFRQFTHYLQSPCSFHRQHNVTRMFLCFRLGV